MNKTGAGWTANDYVGGAVEIYAGLGSGQIRRIANNTATQMTTALTWTTIPDNTSKFRIFRGKTSGNKFANIRAEGAAGADFIRVHAGSYYHGFRAYDVSSLGSGKTVNDSENDPSNSLIDGQLVGFTFWKEGIAASLSNSYLSPLKGTAYYQGGIAPLGDFYVKGIEVSCTGVTGGTGTVVVEAGSSLTFSGTLNAAQPNHVYIPGNAGSAAVISGLTKLKCKITTDASWAPSGTSSVYVTVYCYLV